MKFIINVFFALLLTVILVGTSLGSTIFCDSGIYDNDISTRYFLEPLRDGVSDNFSSDSWSVDWGGFSELSSAGIEFELFDPMGPMVDGAYTGLSMSLSVNGSAYNHLGTYIQPRISSVVLNYDLMSLLANVDITNVPLSLTWKVEQTVETDTNGWGVGYVRLSLSDDLVPSAPVPEPSTILLLGSGLLGIGWYGRKRKKA